MDGQVTEQEATASSLHGFAAISRRHTSCKPIIAAVNGSAYGGGVELILNCDIVIASEDAVFALPEVKRGVLASQGGTCRCLCSVRFGSVRQPFRVRSSPCDDARRQQSRWVLVFAFVSSLGV